MRYYANVSLANVDILNKKRSHDRWMESIYNMTNRMFKYTNLPDTIPSEVMELYLQNGGNCLFFEDEGKYYVSTGGLGGELDMYYRPKHFIVSNPYLPLVSKQFTIDEDAVLIKNDSAAKGLFESVSPYIKLLVEIEISFRSSIIATRDYMVYSARDEDTLKSVEIHQKKIEEGKTHIITELPILESLEVRPTNIKTSLPELQTIYQRLKSEMYAEIGIKVSQESKSQYVNETDVESNDEPLTPLVQDMLINRQEALEKINKMFNLDIQVELSSVWELRELELEQAIELAEEGPQDEEQTSDGETPEAGGEPEETSGETETQETPTIEVNVHVEAENIEEVDVEVKEEDHEPSDKEEPTDGEGDVPNPERTV